MLTNRINVAYNMKNIDEDFDIFRVEKANKDYYKYNILDSAVYEFKATAVQWTYGATALVMFRKGEVTENEFKESLMREYQDVKIQKIDVFDVEECSKNFYFENRLLAQLLFNSMRTPKHDSFMYNNLTGKLLYHDQSWRKKDKLTNKISFMRFLEIVIDPGMFLNLEHKTYRKYDREGSGLYVIDTRTGEFRKKLKTDTNLVTYKEGSLPHNHFRVDNFDITDYEHFRKCKLGVMEQFLQDVEENLSKYISVEMMEREDAKEFEISNLEKNGITEHEYGELLQKKGVVIVDENKSETSNIIIQRLKDELERYCHIEATVGELSKGAYNIRIIHNEEYYEENEIIDPHNDDLKGYIVQHMTEEAELFLDSKGLSPAIKKIVQELIIKGDVSEKMISIFDWNRLDSGKDWTFIIRKKLKTEFGDKTEHKNRLDKKSFNYYTYYRLQINCKGNLEFDSYCEKRMDGNNEWDKLCYAYDFVEDKHHGINNQVEGLVYSDIDNIHAILLTREKTIPNITALCKTLKETDVKQLVKKDILLDAMDKFESKNQSFKENISEWKYQVSNEEESITKKRIKKIINLRTNCASMFNRFFHENYGIWIDGELRKNEFEATFQIGNLLDIKYEYKENDFVDGDIFVYYVGAKSKKLSYPNACCMRKVITLGEKLEYEEVLPLMAVEFVRNSQYTVLPFPFKYLREYMAQCSS